MIVGFATGFEIVVLLNPLEGDQTNVPLPVPFNVVLEPKQMETSGPALAVGKGLVETVTASLYVPQDAVMLSV